MIVYRNKQNSAAKWILAIVVFALAMTFTVDSVDGFNFPSNNGGKEKPGKTNTTITIDDQVGNGDQTQPSPSPSTIPEPATLILLASGLGTMYALRRKNKVK